MKSAIRKMTVLSVAAVMAAGVSRAQFSANYQTNTVDGVGVNWAGDYIVGSNTSFNVLQVLNGGALTNVNGYLAFDVSSSNNLVVVNGAGSHWLNSTYMHLGYYGTDSRLIVTNGGKVTVVSRCFVGRQYGSTRNHLQVTGIGSVFNSLSDFAVGQQGPGNQMTVSDGGQVLNTSYGAVGYYSNGNKVLVTGAGSLWKALTKLYLGFGVGYSNNQLIITNSGCVVDNDAYIGYDNGTTNNSVLVAGKGSVWTNGGASVGYRGSYNYLAVTDGGQVISSGSSYVGTFSGANSNRLVVSGEGSVFKSDLEMGREGCACQMIVTNGGWATVRYGSVGSSSNGNRVVVSGVNSRWDYSTLVVGNKGSGNQFEANNGATVAGPIFPTQYNYIIVGGWTGSTGNLLKITSGGMLDVNTLIVTNAGNSIVNSGGIYQFSSATPTITTNGIDAVSPIMLTNGVISFRGIANAPLGAGTQLTRINYQGDNGYRLNNATNASVASYTFDSVANTANQANYQSLHLTGVNPRWQGTALTIGPGGALRVYDTTASVGAAFTNKGAIYISNATLTFSQAATMNGTAVIDLDRLASADGVVFNTALTLGAASAIQLTTAGSYTNEQPVVLFRYTGTRSGTFASQIGVPRKYTIMYGPETDGTVRLIRDRGTVLRLQ